MNNQSMQRQENTTYKQIELPEELVAYLKSSNGIRTPFKEQTYSVTELVRCKRNTFFKKSRYRQEEMITDNIADLWSSVRGNLLHNMSNAYSWNELEGSLDVILDDGRKIKVCGRLDMYDYKTMTILDLKTIDNVKELSEKGYLPVSDHIMQIQAYYTIFSKIIPVEKLNLIYADMNEMVNFEIPLRDLSGWIKSRVSEIQSHIESENIPSGEISSKCRFCKYQTACFNNGGGIKENPGSVPTFSRKNFN